MLCLTMPLRRRSLLTATLCAALLLLPLGCAKRESRVEAGNRTGTLHLAISAEPRELDPQLQGTFDEMCVSLALFEGLTAIDERSSLPVPAAAERWETSADGLRWSFHLRPGLRWSDGAPLTAADFAWSLQRALTPALASEYAYVLYPIRGAQAFNAGKLPADTALGVRVLDPLTLELALERPTPHLAAILALPVAFPIPRTLLEKLEPTGEARRWSRPEHFVGNGPFVLTEWSPNRQIVARRNPYFHEPAALTAIVFHPFEQATAQEAAFRTGQLHLTSDLPAVRIADYRANRPEALRLDPFLETNFLRFNTTRPPLDDPRVRRSLTLALDRRALVEQVALAGQQPATGLLSPQLPGYTPPAGVSFEPETARRLLAEAGYPDGHGFPELEAMYFSSELNQKLLEAMQQMWQRELGITVTLAAKEKQVWFTEERRLAYQLSLARWIGDYVEPSTFLELFIAGGGNNATGWARPEYDHLVRTGASEADSAARNTHYRQAEELLLQDLPIAPLFHGTRPYLIQPSVQGWEPALLGFHRYQHVRLGSPAAARPPAG
ncbi:MAG: peptide ABC transporter substrate-binding protein [Opitutaceae bacterium]|nr:peptide ABC transporter substrate-binding protein [Opitutaceae bacterium]